MLIDAFKYNTLILRLLKKTAVLGPLGSTQHVCTTATLCSGMWLYHARMLQHRSSVFGFPYRCVFQRSHPAVPCCAVPVPCIIADSEFIFSVYAGLSQFRGEGGFSLLLCSDCATGTCLPPSVFFLCWHRYWNHEWVACLDHVMAGVARGNPGAFHSEQVTMAEVIRG